ncbi:MAG: hypothetical protein KDD73_07820 [Anaerolineales bacterium]|nr:hypothetical protein [Anaerolineales bacterium]MCB9128677.1 hypothetical protein [Ardenticatenales bacterium]
MNFEEWAEEVPESIRQDQLWRLNVYRQALFLGDVAQRDAITISQRRQWWSLSD